jgi:nucleoside-diphosphate-sugar epimerase
MGRKVALVIGATGVVGRSLIEHLAGLDDWRTVGVARRVPEDGGRIRYVSADLLDGAGARAALADPTEVTHLFYAGFVDRPTQAEQVAPNLALLTNAVEALEATAPGLERVVLVEGTKWYGVHRGPFKTPAREDDPRTLPPMFYFDQEDYLRARAPDAAWTWSALRPQTVCGFAVGFPMNLMTVIPVYAAICKELGLPFRFPGKPGAYDAIYQVTDATHLARAQVWAATKPRCAGEAFNITNGDFFRWRHLWPRLADFFGLEVGEVHTVSLTEVMADKGPLWDGIAKKHGLAPYPYQDLAAWPFADYVFGCDYDVMSNTTKARQFGFHDVVDTEEMFLRHFAKLRADKVIP